MTVADIPCYSSLCAVRRDPLRTLASAVVKGYLYFGHIRLCENALSLSAVL
jgi:hypothetical protein